MMTGLYGSWAIPQQARSYFAARVDRGYLEVAGH